ncbi:MAG: hypothetical protein EAZ62_05455 [Sphingobacteriia bacterium]|nr:MAG: hypothetical protein EAZ62_05455 [Sphingobacteriia bacterium]
MKTLVAIVLTAFLAFVLGLFTVLPWWTFVLTSALVAWLLKEKPGASFLAGFAGLFLLWGGLALKINMANESLLASKVAQILPLGGSAVALILLTAVLGGLVSGLAALSGAYLRKP